MIFNMNLSAQLNVLKNMFDDANSAFEYPFDTLFDDKATKVEKENALYCIQQHFTSDGSVGSGTLPNAYYAILGYYDVATDGWHPDTDFNDYMVENTPIKKQFLISTGKLPAVDEDGDELNEIDFFIDCDGAMEWFENYIDEILFHGAAA